MGCCGSASSASRRARRRCRRAPSRPARAATRSPTGAWPPAPPPTRLPTSPLPTRPPAEDEAAPATRRRRAGRGLRPRRLRRRSGTLTRPFRHTSAKSRPHSCNFASGPAHARRPHGYSRSSKLQGPSEPERRSICNGSHEHQQGRPDGQPHARSRAAQHPQRHSGLLAAGRLQHPPQGRLRRVGRQAQLLRRHGLGRARARTASQYLSKGRPVAVDGRLEWREWQDKEGNKRQSVDIIADSVQFLGSRDSEGGGNGSRFTPQSDVPADTADFQPAPAGGGGGGGAGRRHPVLRRVLGPRVAGVHLSGRARGEARPHGPLARVRRSAAAR